MISGIADIWQYRAMIKHMFVRDLKLRYERSVLGFAWTLMNPAAMLVVYTIFFSYVVKLGIPRYPIFLLPALLSWNFVTRGMTGVSAAVWHNAYLISRVKFPHESLVISGMLTLLSDFVLELIVLTGVLIAVGSHVGPAMLFLPAAVLILALFGLGLSLFFAVWVALYRDTEYLLGILVTAWFYGSPIFYPMSLVPERFQGLYKLNPMVHMISLFREPIYSGNWPSIQTIAIAAGLSLFMLFTGWTLFRLYSPKFAELL